MELWLASDEYANWKLDAVESLLGDCDVDLHSKGFWSSKLKADLLREELHKMLIDLLQNDRERLLATVVMAVADRRPATPWRTCTTSSRKAMQPKRSRRLPNQSQQATQQKPLHSIRNRTWRMQHDQ